MQKVWWHGHETAFSVIRKQKQMTADTQLAFSLFSFYSALDPWLSDVAVHMLNLGKFPQRHFSRLFQVHWRWWQRLAITLWARSGMLCYRRKLLLCELMENTWIVNHPALTPGRNVSDKTNRESSLFKLLLYCLNWWQHVIFFLAALTIICFI